jgi:methionyl-tRNA formyltransferase
MVLCKNQLEAKFNGDSAKIVNLGGERIDSASSSNWSREKNNQLAKVLFLCDYDKYPLKVLKWLTTLNFCTVTAVVIPSNKEGALGAVKSITNLPDEQILRGHELSEEEVQNKIRSWQPDIVLSVYFPQIIRREILDIPRLGAVNLHPSLLPHNRGTWPELWALIDQTPAGITLHYMDEGVDTGDIIAQREVPSCWYDTGETLLQKIEDMGLSLLKEEWQRVIAGKSNRITQQQMGTLHKNRELEKISKISLDKTYTAIDLINILRAVTIPNDLPGAYFEMPGTGEKVYMELRLRSESEAQSKRQYSLDEINKIADEKKISLSVASSEEISTSEINRKRLSLVKA